MMPRNRNQLANYVGALLAKGQIVFSDTAAVAALGTNKGAFHDAAAHLLQRRLLINPRRGFYVIVPAQYATWGAPPPSWYIDPLMRHDGRSYYVGLLKAAELHGATHQSVMEFQVITDKQLPSIHAGRSLISFHYRKDMAQVVAGIEPSKTDTGTMNVSSPELTALDLVRYPRAAGGIDNLVTVLADLGPKLDAQKLAHLSARAERSVVQRLGYLLERSGQTDTGPLYERVLQSRRSGWVELSPSEAAHPELAPAIERNARWHVTVRHEPEIDQ